jgi:signal transduction histidine kinase
VALLLSLLLGAAWFLAGTTVLKPLMSQLIDERVDRAIRIVEETEESDDPRERAREIMDEQNVVIRRTPPPSKKALKSGRAKQIERKGRDIYILKGPHSPIIVEVDGLRRRSRGDPDNDETYLEVVFPADLGAPEQKIAIGLALLVLVGILLAIAASRWMLRPLQLTSSAMDRVASGDLAHRVPEGGDAAGRMGRSFNAMAGRLQQLVEGQQELMAGVSHELRTPLARLRLHGELLRDQGMDPRRVDAIDADVAEMDGLVEELLEASRLRDGRIALRLEPVELSAWVEQALGSEDLVDRPIDLDLESGIWLQGDSRRLHRALCNLLSNIRRYTPGETAVRICGGRGSEGVFLQVEDHGPGVQESSLSQLFDPFFREERSRSKATGGLGLGMMLVKRIVEAHGARVVAQNKDSGGLVVRMEGFIGSSPSGGSSGSDQESG